MASDRRAWLPSRGAHLDVRHRDAPVDAVDVAGTLIRDWRQRRRVVPARPRRPAGVSARHVSFIETGRSRPTSQMILRLCHHLDVPLREQNRLLLAGGFAPVHPEHALGRPADGGSPRGRSRRSCGRTCRVPPWPWTPAGTSSRPTTRRTRCSTASRRTSLEPPVNVIRLSLDPGAWARASSTSTSGATTWSTGCVASTRRADPRLRALLDELGRTRRRPGPPPRCWCRCGCARGRELSLLSTTTVFGTPREVTLSELAIETFFPADDATRAHLARG